MASAAHRSVALPARVVARSAPRPEREPRRAHASPDSDAPQLQDESADEMGTHPTHRTAHSGNAFPTHSAAPLPRCPASPHYRRIGVRLSIQRYSQAITPTKPSTPRIFAGPKSSGTSPIGASFEKATMRPALNTPHRLSPTINPEATSVASRSARSWFSALRIFPSYQWATTVPTTTANVADIGR